MLRHITIAKHAALSTTSAVILLGTGLLYWNSFTMMPSILTGYPGDAFFPRIVLCAILLFATILLVGSLRAQFNPPPEPSALPEENEQRFPIDLLELATILVLSLGYMALIRPLGFEIVTAVFLFILLERRLRMPTGRRIIISASISIIAMMLIYVLFILGLRVSLPLLVFPSYVSF